MQPVDLALTARGAGCVSDQIQYIIGGKIRLRSAPQPGPGIITSQEGLRIQKVSESCAQFSTASLYTLFRATGWKSTPSRLSMIRFALALVYSGAMTAS